MIGAYGAISASLPAHHEYPQYSSSSALEQRHYNPMTHQYNYYSQPQHVSQGSSRTASRPASPVFQQASLPDPSLGKNRMATSSTVASYLQLPPTIAHGKAGSLAEFAAQITCLFWFESSSTLTTVEEADSSPMPTSPLAQEAFPVTGFLKWVTTILTTTQVTQNVVLLALLFVYRLKKQNPLVKGKPGSEYRLLTVALMLGNKFLDDNTYTNKTWAEVSGISVHEIHVMEVEFLSHMKYNLYTSKEAWENWHTQLGNFWTYFDLASRKLTEIVPRSNSLRPTTLQIPYPLPSPPTSNAASPPYVNSASPNNFSYSNVPASLPYHPTTSVSPVGSASEHDVHMNGRKRSWDEALPQEPYAKRHFTLAPHQLQGVPGAYGQTSQTGPLPSLPNLPVPNLPFPQGQQGYQNPVAFPTQATLPTQTSLPAGRSTPGPYLSPVNWLQAVHPSSGSAVSTPTGPHTYSQAANNSQAPSRRQIPGFGAPSFVPNSADDSRAGRPGDGSLRSGNLPSVASHTYPHPQLSPSHYLSKRTSPYRPVRNISTLLVPPPSNQMSLYPANVSYNQMHWQPLSKTTDETRKRTGQLPYLHREAWPQVYPFEQWPSQYPAG